MASLGDIPLFDTDTHCSGAAFALVEAPSQSFSIEVENTLVELHLGQRDLVVHLSGAHSPESALKASYGIGQRTLDLLSIRSQCQLAIRAPAIEHTLWWTHDHKTILRVVRSASFELPEIRVTASIRDSTGAIRSVPPVSHYSTALRYYRMAQITVDLYDAFRNLYLALEHLLSNKSPYKGGGELPWLNRALKEADDVTLLGSMVAGNDAAERAKWISKRLYATRGRIFHSKVGEKIFLPHESLEEQIRVGEDSRILSHLVVRILDSWHQVRGPRAEFSDAAINAMADATWRDARILASADTSALDSDNGGLSHSRFKKAVPLKTVVGKHDRPAGWYRLVGSMVQPVSHGLPVIQRVDVVNADSVMLTQTDESPIALDGVYGLEYVIPSFPYATWLPMTLASYSQPQG